MSPQLLSVPYSTDRPSYIISHLSSSPRPLTKLTITYVTMLPAPPITTTISTQDSGPLISRPGPEMAFTQTPRLAAASTSPRYARRHSMLSSLSPPVKAVCHYAPLLQFIYLFGIIHIYLALCSTSLAYLANYLVLCTNCIYLVLCTNSPIYIYLVLRTNASL